MARAAQRRYARTTKGKYTGAKHSAKRRGWNFDFSFEEYEALLASTKRMCFYCGYSLSKCGTSLDRIDSKQGYTKENTVPCCTLCNMSKSNLTLTRWKNWIRRAYKRMGLGEDFSESDQDT